MRIQFAMVVLGLLTACQAEPESQYVERVPLDEAQQFASEPTPSPDVTGAVWAVSKPGERLLYGIPGQTPMLAMACTRQSGANPASGTLTFTRFVAADAKAKALMALVGNSHVARIPVDAIWNGRAWLWEGSVDASNGDMAVLTGSREVELTIPGAGSLMLGSSTLPGDLVNSCAGLGRTDGQTNRSEDEQEADATPLAEVDLQPDEEVDAATDEQE